MAFTPNSKPALVIGIFAVPIVICTTHFLSFNGFASQFESKKFSSFENLKMFIKFWDVHFVLIDISVVILFVCLILFVGFKYLPWYKKTLSNKQKLKVKKANLNEQEKSAIIEKIKNSNGYKITKRYFSENIECFRFTEPINKKKKDLNVIFEINTEDNNITKAYYLNIHNNYSRRFRKNCETQVIRPTRKKILFIFNFLSYEILERL